jgi:ankyrin repeat protein
MSIYSRCLSYDIIHTRKIDILEAIMTQRRFEIHPLFQDKPELIKQPFFEAIVTNNYSELRELIRSNRNLINIAHDGVYPLQVALVYNSSLAEVLLSEHSRNPDTPSMWMLGEVIPNALIVEGSEAPRMLYSLLMLAAKFSDSVASLARLIQEYEINPDALPYAPDNLNPLNKLNFGSFPTVVLSENRHLNFPTLIEFCVDLGRIDIIKFLLENTKLDPNWCYYYCNVPALHLAVIQGRMDICKLLLLNGADPERKFSTYPNNIVPRSSTLYSENDGRVDKTAIVLAVEQGGNPALISLLWIFTKELLDLPEKFDYLQAPNIKLPRFVAAVLSQYRENAESQSTLNKSSYPEAKNLLERLINSVSFPDQIKVLHEHLSRQENTFGVKKKLTKLSDSCFDSLLMTVLFADENMCRLLDISELAAKLQTKGRFTTATSHRSTLRTELLSSLDAKFLTKAPSDVTRPPHEGNSYSGMNHALGGPVKCSSKLEKTDQFAQLQTMKLPRAKINSSIVEESTSPISTTELRGNM